AGCLSRAIMALSNEEVSPETSAQMLRRSGETSCADLPPRSANAGAYESLSRLRLSIYFRIYSLRKLSLEKGHPHWSCFDAGSPRQVSRRSRRSRGRLRTGATPFHCEKLLGQKMGDGRLFHTALRLFH